MGKRVGEIIFVNVNGCVFHEDPEKRCYVE